MRSAYERAVDIVLRELRSEVTLANQRIDRIATSVERLAKELANQRASNAETVATLAELRESVNRLADQSGDHARQLRLRAVMDWIAQAYVSTDTLVSIVTPTRDRVAVLPRAIASAKAQSYSNWELLIVDDGSSDGTADYLRSLDDERIRTFTGKGEGCCAARNIALENARGTVVTYLDDDNIMHPDWLKSVVWAFTQRPKADVLYGGFVVDDTLRILPGGSGEMPRLFMHAYNHTGVVQDNVADMGAIAHRSGLPEGRFDPNLREMGDWDLLLRLTRDNPPLVLPAIALFYTTDAPHRLSGGATFESDLAAVRNKNAR